MKVAFPLGINATFWLLVGSIRRLVEGQDDPNAYLLKGQPLTESLHKVAVCIPAHNEAMGISHTIDSMTVSIPAQHVFIASDGSDDETVTIAHQKGCQIVEFTPGQGKALALKNLIDHFHLFDRFDYVLIADADTVFGPDFFVQAVSRFAQDPNLQVITAKAVVSLPQQVTSMRAYFLAYRVRLWQVLEWVFGYGQTWKHTNVNPVIPGYASIYRSTTLRQLNIYVPGIVIEDFSLSFEIHKKRLGRIGHFDAIWAVTQDPDNFVDYWNQLMRWNVGFFQTMKYWKIWPSLFGVFLVAFILENILTAFFFLLIPTFLTLFLLVELNNIHEPHLDSFLRRFSISILVMFSVDYLFTLLVAWKHRDWRIAWHGLFFFVLHYVNAVIMFLAIPKAFLMVSDGRWHPPRRWQTSE